MKRNRLAVSGILTASLLALALPSSALAQAVICGEPVGGDDFDTDGFDDVAECSQLVLRPPLQFRNADGSLTDFVPTCFGTELPKTQCVSAEADDLFLIVVPAPASKLPANLLGASAQATGEGGLGLTLHLVEGGDPTGDRRVAVGSEQQAIRITEDPDPDGDKLGQANYGTPNNLDRVTIWTTRIENFVVAACGEGPCETDTGAVGVAEVTEALTRWVLDHEAGHTLALAQDYDKRFGGYHLKSGEDSIMTQFVSYKTTRKTGVTTFTIPTTFDSQSQQALQLTTP